jgi:Icc-related predicted phosphoesterase
MADPVHPSKMFCEEVQTRKSMKIVFISDVHTRHREITIPSCDILISSGDYSFKGERDVVVDYHEWLSEQPASHIISVNGNHELWVADNYNEAKSLVEAISPRIHMLQHESITIDGIKIYGDATTPYFFNWAWNAGRSLAEAALYNKPYIKDVWQLIPEDTNILVTHGPPAGILDNVKEHPYGVGCYHLLDRVKDLKDLKMHSFGHLHLDGGKTHKEQGVTYINAAICNDKYKAKPERVIVLDYIK